MTIRRTPDLSRRDGLRLAATGTAGLAVASFAALGPASAAPAPRPAAGQELSPGDRAHVAVSARRAKSASSTRCEVGTQPG